MIQVISNVLVVPTITTLRLWDVSTGRNFRTLKGHEAGINCLTMIHCTKQVVSGSADSTIKIWNLSNGTVERTLYGHTDWVYSLKVFENENGTRIASGSWDKSKSGDIGNHVMCYVRSILSHLIFIRFLV